MTRAALLPTPGDPLLLTGWMKLYNKIWKNEVDNLYVLLNSPIEESVVNYIKNLVTSSGAKFLYIPHRITHGDGIKRLLDECKEDYVVLLEDDCFILQPKQIDYCFSIIENEQADIVGSTRLSSTNGIVEVQAKKFNLYETYSPEHGIWSAPHLWPCLLFSKKETLLKTDKIFSNYGWERGDYIPELDYTCETTECGDTFVWTSIQLRAMGCSFFYVHQFHAGSNDLNDVNFKRGLFHRPIPWCHFGSLSSGIGGLLKNEDGYHIGEKFGNPNKDYPIFDGETLVDISRRFSIWKLLYQNFNLGNTEIAEFYKEYKDAVERAIDYYKGSNKIVDRFIFAYKNLFKVMWQ